MRYLIDPERSTVIVAARSSVGPIVFQSRAVEGHVDTEVADGEISLRRRPAGQLRISLDSLLSGNQVYDAELRRRIDSRRFPTCTLELDQVVPAGDSRFTLDATMDFHDRQREVRGTVEVDIGDGRIAVVGKKLLDIRDFGIPAPGILMVKIYPEVDVRLILEATAGDT